MELKVLGLRITASHMRAVWLSGIAALVATGCATNPSQAVTATGRANPSQVVTPPGPSDVTRWYSEAYEVTCNQVGVEGVQLLRVTTIAEDEDEAMSEGRRAAVKSIVFKGVRSATCQVPELVPASNMTPEVDQVMTEVFQDGGPYLQFIVGAGDEVENVTRLSGNQFRVTTLVNVNRNTLVSYLADRGVIDQLGDVFRRRGVQRDTASGAW